MANLIIQENGEVRTRSAIHGEELTIQTPCDCSTVTGVQIADDVFPFCDACGNALAGVGDLFAKDSLIRVLIDTMNNRAIIMNRGITAKNIGAAPISHIDDITNPHQVTPEQIGAVTNANFTSHKNNKNNPHGVTAEQVGATPVSHTLDFDNPHNVTAHQVGARPNDWMPTASEVGAAPATHKHSTSDITSGTLSVARGGTGSTSIVSAREKLEVAQAIESSDYSGCYYRMVGGVQEWINPPMVLDHTEYRTTERYNGKPVYWKLVNFGNLPNETLRSVSHGIPNVEDIVDVSCSARNGSSVVYIPSTTNDLYVNEEPYFIGLTWASGATESNVYVVTTANRTSWSGKFFIKCTKTTD